MTDNAYIPTLYCQVSESKPEGEIVMNISTVGIDIAKNVFQLHGVDNTGKAVLKKNDP